MTVLLSPVSKVVEKIEILNTLPATPATSTKSPTRIARNKINNTLAAKFANEPCNTRKTAKPAAAIMAINDAVQNKQ